MTIDITTLDNTQEDMDIEDLLSVLTADLVGLESNDKFLEQLFSINAGKWVNLETLCNDINPIKSQIESLKELYEGTFQVTWLDYPDTVLGKGYCLIIFYLESFHWSNIALYNKQKFLEKFITLHK